MSVRVCGYGNAIFLPASQCPLGTTLHPRPCPRAYLRARIRARRVWCPWVHGFSLPVAIFRAGAALRFSGSFGLGYDDLLPEKSAHVGLPHVGISSHPAVVFSRNKSNSTFSHDKPVKRTGSDLMVHLVLFCPRLVPAGRAGRPAMRRLRLQRGWGRRVDCGAVRNRLHGSPCLPLPVL
jgi:hypothetical protein